MTNKVKIKPYCRWCHNEICVNDECPARGDYCPVPDISGLCRYEERHEMTVRKAWENIAERLKFFPTSMVLPMRIWLRKCWYIV